MQKGVVCLGLTVAAVCLAAPAAVARDLTFEERVAAQEAIERVYWNHRIWPRENPGPKPSLSAVMPDEAIRANVEDYLKKSNALETWWQRPITATQLQAEMDRMSTNTRDGAMLRELYQALGNDPFLIAETLARQTLADRLIHNWYAYDSRLHAAVRQQAENVLARATSVAEMPAMGGAYSEVTLRLRSETDSEPATHSEPIRMQVLSRDEWDEQTDGIAEAFGTPYDSVPTGEFGPLREEADAFVVTAVLARTSGSVTVAAVTWPKVSFDTWWDRERDPLTATIRVPAASYAVASAAAVSCVNDTWQQTTFAPAGRWHHTAVWTGTEMIVWGGVLFQTNDNSGGRYNPATDTWLATSMGDNVPEPRNDHSAVWTGTEMIIWGGYGRYNAWTSPDLNTGGRYNPLTDHWTATSTATNVPTGRFRHTAVWTGTEMIVWGGDSFARGHVKTGGRYDPSTDAWTATSTGVNVPSPRDEHTAVWTGTEMIVWGGDWNTGGRYDPATDTWASTSTGPDAPTGRTQHSTVWTGTEMIVWGGCTYPCDNQTAVATGARYDPSTDTWRATSTGPNVPAGRRYHTAVWTGSRMIVWGGAAPAAPINTGGRYDPTTDLWEPTEAAPTSPRYLHTAVWTGEEMIVWGGSRGDSLDTGARYAPVTGSWVATPTVANVPRVRRSHTAVWTGTEMIVWGGLTGEPTYRPGTMYNDGGRYFPSTDSWLTLPVGANTPSVREGHAALWTGTEMIVWGGRRYRGNYTYDYYGTGGRYSPLSNAWVPTSTGPNVPLARALHSLLWTGTEAIVWGGEGRNASGFTEYLNSGARYDPSSDGWVPTSAGIGVPPGRTRHTAIWTGTEMIVWGGYGTGSEAERYLNSGGRYDPMTGGWTTTSTSSDAPAGRYLHTAVWTGREMIVWGGVGAAGSSWAFLNSGGRYDPATDNWAATSLSTGAPVERSQHSAVWTGAEMIVWGGLRWEGGWERTLDTGGRYVPATDRWLSTSTGANLPQSRRDHTAIWTGEEMIVWGGLGSGRELNTGGRYCAVSNASPTSAAGTDQAIECTGGLQADATLDGSASTDPDSTPGTNDDIVSFEWSESGAPLAGGMIVSVPLALGTHEVTLTVTDRAGATASDDVVVTVKDTMSPLIVCPPSVILECQSAGQAHVTLSPASASDTCYGDAAITNDRTGNGADASGTYPLGVTVVTFTATDGSGNRASCETTVAVIDTIPPVITTVANPSVLWPPNHKMSTVNATALATDACDPAPMIALVSVASSEPDDAVGDGDGHTSDDIQDAAIGTADFQVLLRAERDGNGPGRIYTIVYQAADHSGNTATASAQVAVPHDMSQGIEPINLVLENSHSTVVIWGPVEDARHYDVIRGDLADLRIDGSSIDLGHVVCLARETTATTTLGGEDTELPAPGQVFFYAVQYNDGRDDSSYGSEPAGRARVVRPGNGDCS